MTIFRLQFGIFTIGLNLSLDCVDQRKSLYIATMQITYFTTKQLTLTALIYAQTCYQHKHSLLSAIITTWLGGSFRVPGRNFWKESTWKEWMLKKTQKKSKSPWDTSREEALKEDWSSDMSSPWARQKSDNTSMKCDWKLRRLESFQEWYILKCLIGADRTALNNFCFSRDAR